MSISLPEELARYVLDKVDSGSYSCASEVIAAALRFSRSDEARGRSMRTLSGTRLDSTRADAAIARILEVRNKQRLGSDLSIEGLIHPGREA